MSRFTAGKRLRLLTRRGIAAIFLALVLVPFARAGAFPQTTAGPFSRQIACGCERRDVKMLTDSAASSIAFGNVKASTVTKLGKIHSSTNTPARRPQEMQVYRVKVILDSLPGKQLGYKIETTDNDIHLAVRDTAGKTMIAEFPDVGCTNGAQERYAMKKARDALVAACTKPVKGTFKELLGTANPRQLPRPIRQRERRHAIRRRIDDYPIVLSARSRWEYRGKSRDQVVVRELIDAKALGKSWLDFHTVIVRLAAVEVVPPARVLGPLRRHQRGQSFAWL